MRKNGISKQIIWRTQEEQNNNNLNRSQKVMECTWIMEKNLCDEMIRSKRNIFMPSLRWASQKKKRKYSTWFLSIACNHIVQFGRMWMKKITIYVSITGFASTFARILVAMRHIKHNNLDSVCLSVNIIASSPACRYISFHFFFFLLRLSQVLPFFSRPIMFRS